MFILLKQELKRDPANILIDAYKFYGLQQIIIIFKCVLVRLDMKIQNHINKLAVFELLGIHLP